MCFRSFGLLVWFRKAKLAAGLGELWCRNGGIRQGCPLSTVFIVALFVPWCRHLEALPDVEPQLYADNLKCSAERPGALFESARFSAQSVSSVGQDVSLAKCVLLSTSKSVRKSMQVTVAFGRFNWMLGIWAGILNSLFGLGLGRFPKALVRLLLGLLLLVLYLWFSSQIGAGSW